jgi:hypothetical protein
VAHQRSAVEDRDDDGKVGRRIHRIGVETVAAGRRVGEWVWTEVIKLAA